MSKNDRYINKIIFQKYLIRKKIGFGSFSTIYKGYNTLTNEKIVLKVEKREEDFPGILENGALRLIYLKGEGIPKVYCYGNNLKDNLLVEELLGESLEDLFNYNGKPFSLKTVCVLGIEMIKRIQYIHNKYYIIRDIKPGNFMFGRGLNKKIIYLIDFSLSKKYYSEAKAQHIKFTTGRKLIGTARYCCRNSHRGYEQGRRDDIESLGYVLMYFLLGKLPWQELKVKNNEELFEKIAQKKYSTTFEELTAGQPNEFFLFFKHADNLKFEEKPNYIYLMSLFQNVIDKLCKDCFYDFDWDKDKLLLNNSIKDLKNSQKDNSVSDNDNSSENNLNSSKSNSSNSLHFSKEEESEEKEQNEEEEPSEEKKSDEKKNEFENKENSFEEDESSIDDGSSVEENEYNNNNGRMHKSRSMVNTNQEINRRYENIDNERSNNNIENYNLDNNGKNNRILESLEVNYMINNKLIKSCEKKDNLKNNNIISNNIDYNLTNKKDNSKGFNNFINI